MTEGSFCVYRQDDNGTTFAMRHSLSAAEADRMVEEFTARGHKQMYFVRTHARCLAEREAARERQL